MQNNQNNSANDNVVRFRWFPIRLYTYVVGAGVFGWGVGTGMQDPGTASLIALLAGTTLVLLGYHFMRPYMAAAKGEIQLLDAERTRGMEREHDTDH